MRPKPNAVDSVNLRRRLDGVRLLRRGYFRHEMVFTIRDANDMLEILLTVAAIEEENQ